MKKQIIIGDHIFNTQSACEKYTRQILTELGVTSSVKSKNEIYFYFLFGLCERHPYSLKKLSLCKDFSIGHSILNSRGLELNIINEDGSTKVISWHICIRGEDRTSKTQFNSALRYCISNQICAFKDASDLSYCNVCECDLDNKTIHIDHYEPQFIKIVENFLELNNETISIPSEYTKKDLTYQRLFKENDVWIGKLFEKYHLQHATLRVLCENCNLTRTKCKI